MRRRWKRITFITYFTVAIWLLFFFPFTHASRLNPEAKRYVTLIPFKNTHHYFQQFLQYPNQKHTLQLIANVGGNIMLFIPLWVFVCYSGMFWRSTLIIGLLSSLLVESIQILTYVGNFDVDDIIWNTTGTLIGYLVVKRYRKALA